VGLDELSKEEGQWAHRGRCTWTFQSEENIMREGDKDE